MKNNKKSCLILTEYVVNKHFKANIKRINQRKRRIKEKQI